MEQKLRTVHIKLSLSEVEEVDKWRAGKGIRTRSEAIRRMIWHVLDEKNTAPQQPSGVAENNPVFTYGNVIPQADQNKYPYLQQNNEVRPSGIDTNALCEVIREIVRSELERK